MNKELKERQQKMGAKIDMMIKEHDKRVGMTREEIFDHKFVGHFPPTQERENSIVGDLLSVDLHSFGRHFDANDEHEWGYQIRMVNTELYCAKLLVLTNKTPGSFHHHKEKDETFICLSGKVRVLYKNPIGLETIWYMSPGSKLFLPPGMPHQMEATTVPAVILEISTHDDDEDFVELEKTEI